jgi:hypothetical protein
MSMEDSSKKPYHFQYMIDRFQEWRKEGIFNHIWIDGLSVYDKDNRIDWKWQAMDGGVITKTPLGEKGIRPNPSHIQTDRSKSGTKRSILVVDGKGIPIDISVDDASRHDMI